MPNSICAFNAIILAAALVGCACSESAKTSAVDSVIPEQVLVEILETEEPLDAGLKAQVTKIGEKARPFKISMHKTSEDSKNAPPASTDIEHENSVSAADGETSPGGGSSQHLVKTTAPTKPAKCHTEDNLCNNLMHFKAFCFTGSFNGEFTQDQMGVVKDLISAMQPTEDPVDHGKDADAGPKEAQTEFEAFMSKVKDECILHTHGERGGGLYCKMATNLFRSLKTTGVLRHDRGHVCLNEKALGLDTEHGMGKIDGKDALCVSVSNYEAMLDKLDARLGAWAKEDFMTNAKIKKEFDTILAWKGDV